MSPPSPSSKAPIGSLRALWPFVRGHMGLFCGWLIESVVFAVQMNITFERSKGTAR